MNRILLLIALLFVHNNHNNVGVLAQQIEDHSELNQRKRVLDTVQATLLSRNKPDPMTTGTTDGSQTSWPALVGLDGQEAKATLEAYEPDLKIVLVPEGAMVTMDYREDRVRIYVDEAGKVARPPRIG